MKLRHLVQSAQTEGSRKEDMEKNEMKQAKDTFPLI